MLLRVLWFLEVFLVPLFQKQALNIYFSYIIMFVAQNNHHKKAFPKCEPNDVNSHITIFVSCEANCYIKTVRLQ